MKSIILNGKEYFYVIERKSVKNINIRIKEGYIYVSAKKSVPEEYIKKLIEKNSYKFTTALDNLKKKNETNLSVTKYLGKEYPVEIFENNIEKVIFDNEKFKVYATNISDKKNILFLILKWKSDRCVELYAELNKNVCKLFRENGYNVPLSIITIKLMKSRWGSCNYVTGRFSINLKLIDYSYECIYGVFCHEYMHYIHQNHSSDFYRDLLKIYPDYRKYDKLLKM